MQSTRRLRWKEFAIKINAESKLVSDQHDTFLQVVTKSAIYSFQNDTRTPLIFLWFLVHYFEAIDGMNYVILAIDGFIIGVNHANPMSRTGSRKIDNIRHGCQFLR